MTQEYPHTGIDFSIPKGAPVYAGFAKPMKATGYTSDGKASYVKPGETIGRPGQKTKNPMRDLLNHAIRNSENELDSLKAEVERLEHSLEYAKRRINDRVLPELNTFRDALAKLNKEEQEADDAV